MHFILQTVNKRGKNGKFEGNNRNTKYIISRLSKYNCFLKKNKMSFQWLKHKKIYLEQTEGQFSFGIFPDSSKHLQNWCQGHGWKPEPEKQVLISFKNNLTPDWVVKKADLPTLTFVFGHVTGNKLFFLKA